MASYPSAVKTFTSKSAGDTIQATHITDLQDEVTALEDGLLNGTAPINSSRITAPSAQITNCTITNLTVTAFAFPANSTLTNVNVTGGSTLASLNVTGGSTLADLTVTANPLAARVTNNADLNTANGSTTRLTFNTQTFASAGMHSTTTNPGRLIAASSGMYLITACVSWNASASTSGYRRLRILIDGSSIVAQDTRNGDGDGLGATHQSVTTIYRFASSGGYAEVEVQQNSGSTLSVRPVGDTSPIFAMTKLR
jgi:hypothetical protein